LAKTSKIENQCGVEIYKFHFWFASNTVHRRIDSNSHRQIIRVEAGKFDKPAATMLIVLDNNN